MAISFVTDSFSSPIYETIDFPTEEETAEMLRCIYELKRRPSSQRLFSDIERLEKMIQEGCSIERFQREAVSCLSYLNDIDRSCLQHRVVYQGKKEQTQGQMDRLDADLQNDDLSFPSFEPPVDMRERKTQLAQCLLTSMDPESPFGAMPCLAHHSKGLSAEQEKELSTEVPNLIAGKVITELAAVPAVVNKVAHLAVKALVLGSAAEGLAEADPANFHERLEEVRVAFDGQNPQFNEAMKEFVPEWAKSVGGVIQKGVDYAGQVDQYTQEQFYTSPGIVQEGIVGTAEIATMAAMAAAGPALKYSLRAARTVAQAFEVSAPVDSAVTRKMAIAAKRNAAYADYAQGLHREKAWVQTLETHSVPLDLPKSFPQHINQFYRECQAYPFKSTKLGANQNGILKGNLLYTQAENEGLFVVQFSKASDAVWKKVGTWDLIESTHLSWEERLGHILDTITRAAKEIGLERVYVAWDPSHMPLATVLYRRSQSILGTSSLSTGLKENPLLVAEITLP